MFASLISTSPLSSVTAIAQADIKIATMISQCFMVRLIFYILERGDSVSNGSDFLLMSFAHVISPR